MTSYLSSIALALQEALTPLETSFESEGSFERVLDQFGWNASIAPSSMASIRTAFALTSLFQNARMIAEQLRTGAANEMEIAEALIKGLGQVLERVRALNTVPPTGLNFFPFDEPTFWNQFPLELADYLLFMYLEQQQPLIFGLLFLFGIAEVEEQNPTGRGRVPYRRHKLHWDRLARLVGDPPRLLKEIYRWDDSAAPFDHNRLLRALERCLLALQIPVRRTLARKELAVAYYLPTSQFLPAIRELAAPFLSGFAADGSGYVELGVLLFPIPPRPSPSGLAPSGILITTLARGYAGIAVQLGNSLSLSLKGGFDADAAAGIEIYPKEVHLALGTPTLEAEAALEGRPRSPWLLIGNSDSHRAELGGVWAAVKLRGELSDPELILELGTGRGADAPKIAVVIQNSDADNFIKGIIGSQPQRFEVGGLLTWSSKTGLVFSGQAGITMSFPINKTIGVVEIDSLMIAIWKAGTGVDAIVAVNGGTKIGPISVSVDKIGIKLALAPIPAGKPPGTFGDLDITFGFKPPDGLGILVDAGPITGGGFISFDDAKGRYAGILQLRAGEIAIKAIGLLDTRLPGGQPGYSFLLIITGEFPPIQLGFGFTLTGLGGLAGIHRTMVTESLQAGIRSHSVDHILFPEDPVRDAPQIISDLSSIFPPAEGRYVFGPMARIGYGTPTLITAELGILLELPDPVRLVLLGQLHAILPRKEEPVVELHLDVLGVIDFGKKTLAIDAVLHDSKLAEFDLYGDMALRLAWGDQPVFVLSVGGFHPAFQPPPAFPALRRLTLALGDGGNPRLTLQTYLALTSNTLQFGALAELYAEDAGFNLSGWLGFDVLVVLSPFSLLAELGTAMALRRGRTLIAGVSLAATLTGPTPWHLWGQATLDAIIDVTVDFDVTIGPDVEERLPDLNPSPLLMAEFAKPGNWSATLPPAGLRVVSLAPPPAGQTDPILDPLGGATVRQRVVPLNRTLTKFGEAKPLGPGRYDVSGISVGSTPSVPSMAQEFFAPAQFEEMSDAAKLSRPSFERMDAGFTIASNAVAVGDAIGTDVVFNTIILDQPNAKPLQLPMSEAHQRAVLARSVSARAPLATTGQAKFAPAPTAKPLVALRDEGYQVVDVDTLSIEPGALAEPTSKGAAYQALAAYLTTHPAERGRLQVVPLHEVAT